MENLIMRLKNQLESYKYLIRWNTYLPCIVLILLTGCKENTIVISTTKVAKKIIDKTLIKENMSCEDKAKIIETQLFEIVGGKSATKCRHTGDCYFVKRVQWEKPYIKKAEVNLFAPENFERLFSMQSFIRSGKENNDAIKLREEFFKKLHSTEIYEQFGYGNIDAVKKREQFLKSDYFKWATKECLATNDSTYKVRNLNYIKCENNYCVVRLMR